MAERIKWIDALKCFAIFLVLWGHCIQYLLSSEYYDEPMYRIIYSFHMPLFMMLVGFFGTNLINRSFKRVVIDKFRQLIIPGISFAIFGFLINLNSGIESKLSDEILNSFWFLKSAFICSLLYYLSIKIIKSQNIAILISLLISQFITRYSIPYMYPSFILGVFINLHLNYILEKSKIIIFISGGLFVIMLLFWDSSFWNNKSVINDTFDTIYFNKYLYYLYKRSFKILIGLLGSLFFFLVFEFFLNNCLFENKFSKFITQIGKFTLGIYLLQSFLLELWLPKIIQFDNWGFVFFNFVIAPLISVIILFISIGIIRLIKCQKYLSFLFLGDKLSVHKSLLIKENSID